MSLKHTPGPWGFGLGDNESQDVCTETGEHICTVEQYPIKENAALIAAAPDLLAALGHLVGVCEGRTLPNEKHPAVVQARDAIAKAKGGAS